MDKITAVGLDLAKQIIQVHGIDVAGRVVLRKAMRRERLLALLAQLPRCLVGMEACSSAHRSNAGLAITLDPDRHFRSFSLARLCGDLCI